MTLHLKMPSKVNNLSPKISVIGIGGAGGNIINSMIESQISGVSFLNVNTDSQQLKHSSAEQTLQLGPNCTQGLGAGADPEVGKAAAEEVVTEIQEYLEDANMVFLTAGMGGGTGTGASPVVARVARDMGILIVGVVTKPFVMEGKLKMEKAEEGIRELQKFVDNLIVIPNQNIFHSAKPETTFTEAFQLANNVLINGVKSIIDVMVKPGVVNHDFADVQTVMKETGKVHMGTGIAEDNDRALKATEEAISNPLLENNSMSGARGVLINITGGKDLTLHEVEQAISIVKEEIDENAINVWGITEDQEYTGKFKISVIATGIDSDSFSRTKSENNVKNIGNLIQRVEKEQPIDFNDSKSSFFVDLKNPVIDESRNINLGQELRELEEKARKVKEENPPTEKKASFFSKIFGQSKSKPLINEVNKQYKNSSIEEIDNSGEIETQRGINFEENETLDIEEKQSHNRDDDLLQIPAFLRRQVN